MRSYKNLRNSILGLALTLAASGVVYAAADTSETQPDSTDGRPNACTAQQIEGGYEDLDGECLLTGWNWIINGKCVSGSCGAPGGCITAICDCPASGCGGGNGGSNGGIPDPTPPQEWWDSNFHSLESECEQHGGAYLGVKQVHGQYYSECAMDGDGAIVCIPQAELTDETFDISAYYDGPWICEFEPDYDWPEEDPYDDYTLSLPEDGSTPDEESNGLLDYVPAPLAPRAFAPVTQQPAPASAPRYFFNVEKKPTRGIPNGSFDAPHGVKQNAAKQRAAKKKAAKQEAAKQRAAKKKAAKAAPVTQQPAAAQVKSFNVNTGNFFPAQ